MIRQVGIYAGLAPFLVIALFPVLWMIITAFKHEQDLYAMRFPLWFHQPPTLKHFRLLFTQTWFGTWVVNTTCVSLLVVAITLATSVPAAYALTRLRLWGAGGAGIAMLIRGDIYFWGSLMAGALLVGLPAAVAFNLVLDRFIQGLTGVSDQ
jgi:ABC-type glycerol-3-phosphate transport system permease component